MKKIQFNLKKVKILSVGIIILCILLAGLVYMERGRFSNIKNKIDTISAEKSIDDAKKAVTEGKKDDAIKLYEDAVKKDPENNVAKDELAMLYYQTTKYDKAVETWSDSLETEPDNSFVLNSLANSYRDQGNTDEAIKTYLKAIETGNLDSVGNLVTLYNSASRFDESITLLNSLIVKYPEDKDLKQLLASSYSKKGDENS